MFRWIYILNGRSHQFCFCFNISAETPGPVRLLQIRDSIGILDETKHLPF